MGQTTRKSDHFYGFNNFHCIKSVQMRSFFLDRISFYSETEYGELQSNLHIQSEYNKMKTRKSSIFAHFSHSIY